MSVQEMLAPRRSLLNGKVNFPLCLAPMVGLSHSSLRMVIRQYLPSEAKTIWPTEMLNSWKIPKEDLGKTPETFREASETELVPQILGNEEDPIRESVQRLQDWGAEGIDINMGCPVQKALRHNYGVALMGDAKYAADVVAMTQRASALPVSVKLRAGPDGNLASLVGFVKGLEDAGASWVTLHPRTPEQKRRGEADWSQIQFLRQKISIPVIGNGDIQTAEDVFRMQRETGCDLVMSGRALAARPWMVWQVAEDLGLSAPQGFQGRRAPRSRLEEGAEFGSCLLQLFDLLIQNHNEGLALRKFRFHIRMTGGWLDFGHALFSAVTMAKTGPAVREAVVTFFSQDIEMNQRTQLRE